MPIAARNLCNKQMQQQSAVSGEHQQTDAAAVGLLRRLQQRTDGAIVELQRQLHQQSEGAIVDLQRQLHQHFLKISALEAEKAELQSQLSTAAEKSQERIQTSKQRIKVLEEPFGSVAKESSTEGVPAKMRRLDPPGRSGSNPNAIILPIANEHHLTMETLPPDTLQSILSYCGLRTLVTLRRVSKQFRALSDGVPKKWINLSDLFKPDLVDLSERIAIAVHYAGTGVVGFSDFTKTPNDSEYSEVHLRGLPLLLSIKCPNLKTLRLPHLDILSPRSGGNIMNELYTLAAFFPNLEEITAVFIPPQVVVALPALRRINGTVDKDLVVDEVDLEALAWKLSGCRHIGGIGASLVRRIANHFCEKDELLCPEIRGFGGELEDLDEDDDGYQQVSRLVDCVARMFPELWFCKVAVFSEDFARCLSPIAHRIKSAELLVVGPGWTFEETPIAFSNMVCLKDLTIEGELTEEYRDYFSFLSKLEQLEHLTIYMEECTGWSCLMCMLSPSALLRTLNIACVSLPDDFYTHFKALAASGVQLKYLSLCLTNELITISVLRPLFEDMPSIEKVVLWLCADDVFQFVPRTLANLTYFSISDTRLSQILDLAEERIESGKVVPKLTVQFPDASSVDVAQCEKLQRAGMELKEDGSDC